MRAGITIDDWKLPVFEKRLTEAGFKPENCGSVVPGVTLLSVETDDAHELARIFKAAAAECRKLS